MSKVVFGNHSSVLVPQQDRDNIRTFYCDVLGGRIMRADPERDFVRLGEDFYIAFLYGDVPDESEFLRSARSVWLEIKSGNVEEMSRKILESGLVRKLEVPDPHLYFQAPGGQCLRLVGIEEELSFYEGVGDGPNMEKVKEALKNINMKQQDFNATITVSNSTNEAFNTIRDVSKWWTKNITGNTENIGDVFTVTFGDTFATFRIIEIVPAKKVVWLTTDCNLHWMKNKKEWKDTKISFEIYAKDGATKIKFTHIGLLPEIECFSDCSAGWTHYITKSLFKLLTEQKGMPDDPNHSAIERQ